MAYNQDLTKFYVISILVHILFWSGATHLPQLVLPQKPVPVEVVYETPQKRQPPRQVVRQVDIPNPVKVEKEDPAHFLSERDQRVKEQTKAARLGDATINRSDRARSLDLRKPLRFPTPDSSLAQNDQGPGVRRDSRPLEMFPGVDLSERSETLPDDIKVGSMTALNADRYLFYSFYDRLEKSVVPRWRQHVHRAINEAQMRNQFRPPPGGQWTTVVEVILTPEGEYVSANVVQASGWDPLDKAPMLAFSDAGRVPHPPPEMVKADGYIHVLFGGTVFTGPGRF